MWIRREYQIGYCTIQEPKLFLDLLSMFYDDNKEYFRYRIGSRVLDINCFMEELGEEIWSRNNIYVEFENDDIYFDFVVFLKLLDKQIDNFYLISIY